MTMELPQLPSRLDGGFNNIPQSASRPIAPYDEAVLSKFHKNVPGGDASSTQLGSNHQQFFGGATWPKPKDDDGYRFYRLVMYENASKGWYRGFTKPEAYFDHLDPHPQNIKQDPSLGRSQESLSAMRSAASSDVGGPSGGGGVPQQQEPSSSFVVRTPPNVPIKVYSSPVVGVKRHSETDSDALEQAVDHPHKMQRLNQTRTTFLVPPPAMDEEQPLIPMAERNIDREDVYFTVLKHPLKHQVKEFNILPATVLQLMRHYQNSSSSADYLLVKLLCDPRMAKGDIFLTAISTHYSQNAQGEIAIPSLKVSQKMLPGRTKGFVFRLVYELHVDGKVVQSETSSEFFIWSNVNQKGYPRKERDQYISQRIESNKKKTKPKKHPGRPKKKRLSDSDGLNGRNGDDGSRDDDGDGTQLYEEPSE